MSKLRQIRKELFEKNLDPITFPKKTIRTLPIKPIKIGSNLGSNVRLGFPPGGGKSDPILPIKQIKFSPIKPIKIGSNLGSNVRLGFPPGGGKSDPIIKTNFVKPVSKITISSQVLDNSGTPLSEVAVSVNGTLTGTQTDINGFFSISVDPQDTITLTHIGFKPITKDAKDVSKVITIFENTTVLEEVKIYAKKNKNVLLYTFLGTIGSVIIYKSIRRMKKSTPVNNKKGLKAQEVSI